MFISNYVVFLIGGLLAVSQLSCALSIDVPTYAVCSANPACGYLYTADKTHGFCGYLETPCSGLNLCGGLSNDLCFKSGEICISHPRCQSLHVCYPSTMASSVLCPPIPVTTTSTTTTTTTITTTTPTTTTTTKSTTTTTRAPTPAPTTTVKPVLEVKLVQYSAVTATDDGSGAKKNLVIFKPNEIGVDGWSYLGPIAGNKRDEVHYGLIVRGTVPGILMDVSAWSRVWVKTGRMSLWRAITPHPDYVVFGDFFVRSDQPPTQWDTRFMKAVHKDFYTRGTFGQQIWTDSGSGAGEDGAVWKITETSTLHQISAGTFVATPGYGVTSRSVYVLDRSKVRFT